MWTYFHCLLLKDGPALGIKAVNHVRLLEESSMDSAFQSFYCRSPWTDLMLRSPTSFCLVSVHFLSCPPIMFISDMETKRYSTPLPVCVMQVMDFLITTIHSLHEGSMLMNTALIAICFLDSCFLSLYPKVDAVPHARLFFIPLQTLLRFSLSTMQRPPITPLMAFVRVEMEIRLLIFIYGIEHQTLRLM